MRRPDDALGVVEVVGMTAAIAILDRMVKASPVTVSGPAFAGDGLVAWFVHGSVAAVQEAVAVALDRPVGMAAEPSTVVIGRPDETVLEIFGIVPVSPSQEALNGEEGESSVE
ncbi:MAG TPA: BMC domain-containing protein [Candidatus Binatia bacterium]|nr:BMC domain-containing protein [Candidatus Binatia bacterium]